MNTHDTLAFAVASEAVARIRRGEPEWAGVYSPNVYSTSARTWPLPDFVIVDQTRTTATAAEFKPPNQSKREYLTGLGQAVAYTRDFDYSLLITPAIAGDGYAIADHIAEVMTQDVAQDLPIGLLCYDPAILSANRATFDVLRTVVPRATRPSGNAMLENSFYAKWREASPDELGRFLEYLYQEGRRSDPKSTIRDRAFDRLWADMVGGKTTHWAGGRRSLQDSTKQRVAQGKNYRNFVTHIGWCTGEGALTESGLRAHQIIHLYGAGSQLFLDYLAQTVLLAGKHLVLVNEINEYQDSRGSFPDEGTWLDTIEEHLEDQGLLKRNPARGAAAARGSKRAFLKAEKQLWRNLGLTVPHGPKGGRVYHPGRGFIFDWSRITALLSAAAQ